MNSDFKIIYDLGTVKDGLGEEKENKWDIKIIISYELI